MLHCQRKVVSSINGELRRPHLWVVVVTITILAIIHYLEAFTGISTIEKIGSVLGLDLTRHTLERILFLIPVAYGAAMLGVKGGLITLGLTFIVLFPRVFLLSPEPREALFETGGIILTGTLIVSLEHALEKEKSQEEILRTNRELSILNHIAYSLRPIPRFGGNTAGCC